MTIKPKHSTQLDVKAGHPVVTTCWPPT